MSSLAITITNKCFVCNEKMNIEMSPQRTHNKIDLCSDKCRQAFKERLVDEKEIENTPTFEFTVSKEFQPNKTSPEMLKLPPVKFVPGTGRMMGSRANRNLFG